MSEDATGNGSLPPNTPERLGADLRDLRRRRGLTGEDLGALVKMSQAKISKIERGVVRVTGSDVERIARALEVTGTGLERLVEAANWLQSQPVARRPKAPRAVEEFGVPLRRGDRRNPGFDEVLDREASAVQVQSFEDTVVPGLLQTGDFTRRVVSGYYWLAFGESESYGAEISGAVVQRAQRQRQLYDPTKRFEFVLGERALSSPLLTPGFKLAQVDAIEAVARLPNVSIRVIPDPTDLPFPPLYGFTILDGSAVLMEVGTTAVLIRDQQEVEFHRRMFASYGDVAVDDPTEIFEKYKALYAEEARPRD